MQARAKPGDPGEADRAAARELLEGISTQLNFYGLLALEDLGRRFALPAATVALNDQERGAARSHPGLQRGLQLIALGLRNEGVREWNWSLRGMSDRELIAAAQLGCDQQVWDRCINSSDRSRAEIDIQQRYPLPLRHAVQAQAQQVGVDPAFMYGLIRQESRFIMDARSHVGASGLMQLMPATARWTARRVGMTWKPELITDRDTNLLLGATYLKLVLDDFQGSQAMAAAAYNAGPSRPRRWRDVAPLEAAAWAENIPFNETRDYVKKVLANAVIYSAVLNPSAVQQQPTLKQRLGGPIGPRDGAAPGVNRDLP
jgi:soluble lytic murein transglycosylase